MDDEPAPKVTVAHLRRAESMCPWRLRGEHHDRRGNRPGSVRWRVGNHLFEHARLAHAGLAPARPGAFVALPELLTEERAVYEAAARWYVALFGERPVRAIDEGRVDEWETDVPELGVRLVGRAGLVVEGPGGEPEVRVLRLRTGGLLPPDPLETTEGRFAVLRLAPWLDQRPLRICIADLMNGAIADRVVDTTLALRDLRPWLAERVAAIRDLTSDARPRPGIESRDLQADRRMPGPWLRDCSPTS